MSRIDLNSDLGEGFGPWSMGEDAEMLSIVTSANIACVATRAILRQCFRRSSWLARMVSMSAFTPVSMTARGSGSALSP